MSRLGHRPWQLVHRGAVRCHGLILKPSGQSEWDCLRSHWAPASKVYRLSQSELAILFASVRRVDAARVGGTVLVRTGHFYASLPLTPREFELLPETGTHLVDAVGGFLRHRILLESDCVDPSQWFSLQDFEFVLAKPPAPPIDPGLAIEVRARSGRDAIEHSIADRPEEAAIFDTNGTAGNKERYVRTRAVLNMLWSGVVYALRRLAQNSGGTTVSRKSRHQTQRWLSAPSRTPKSIAQRLMDLFRHVVWKSRLGQVFGAAQSRYLGRMLDMFERGDLQEALRHAIPTSKLSSGASTPRLLPGTPRQSLELDHARGARGAMLLSPDIFAHLRATYEAAFAELVNRGQIAEAAFVLSELLEDDARAVSFLESHGRLQQAARLAELRALSPGLVVRQWFLAGDSERAIMIARRDGAFEDAVLRLKGIRAAQVALRLAWADFLASSGNYGGAAYVVRDHEEGRQLARVWLDQAIELGGISGARALGMKVHWYPSEFEQHREHVNAVVEDASSGAAAARVAFVRELAEAKEPAECAVLRALVRKLVVDLSESPSLLMQSELQKFASLSQDGALQADLPQLSETSLSPPTTEAIHLVLRESDRGTTKALDACLLARNQLLLAHGESGCSLLNRAGRLIRHYDVPCERLVLSCHGDRVLALMARDDVWLVSRINLSTHASAIWCELNSPAFARRFDGASWYVSQSNRVRALDVTAERPRTIWVSGEANSKVVAVSWAARAMAFATREGEIWTHEIEPHRLTRRETVAGVPVLGGAIVHATLGPVAREGAEILAVAERTGTRSIPLGASAHVSAWVADADLDWAVVPVDVPVEVPRVIDVSVINLKAFQVQLRVRLEAATRAFARLQQQALIVGDDCGRLLVIDLATRRERLNIRL